MYGQNSQLCKGRNPHIVLVSFFLYKIKNLQTFDGSIGNGVIGKVPKSNSKLFNGSLRMFGYKSQTFDGSVVIM